MPYREFHYRWEYDLKARPEELWPFVADTNRFNRDTNVPAVEANPTKGRLRNARRQVRLSILGMSVEWEEQPFEWVRPHRFGVRRTYSKGPISEMKAVISRVLYDDPGVRDLIDSDNLRATSFEMLLKGFEEQTFQLWRVAQTSEKRATDFNG